MIDELLLYLLVTDLREVGDQQIREFLENIADCPYHPLLEIQERALKHLESDVLDRKDIEGLPEDYPELLPDYMAEYPQSQAEFDELLEEFFEDDRVEENDWVVRFRACLELLHDTNDWQDRSRAARGVGALEEELFQARNHYVAAPFHSVGCTPKTVVAHLCFLDGFEIWLDAFRLAHKGRLEDALETAVEATCIFFAVQTWSVAMSGAS